MKVDLKYLEDQYKIYRHYGAVALAPSALEAVFCVAIVSFGGGDVLVEPAVAAPVANEPVLIGEPIPAPQATPIRKRTKSA